MRILGLDLSLTGTGVALPDGTTTTLAPRLTGVERLAWFRDAIEALIFDRTAARPAVLDVVVIEEYAFSRAAAHSHELGELGGVVRLLLRDLEVPWAPIGPSALKLFATGKGNANKNEMLLAATKRLGYDGNSNDEADALWLRAMALTHYGTPVVDVPQLHLRGIGKVAWPDLTPAAA